MAAIFRSPFSSQIQTPERPSTRTAEIPRSAQTFISADSISRTKPTSSVGFCSLTIG